ncbi:hypothetical protein B0H10DRAFT_1950837 [Mycena sp. CBHHK59/15]|nr:hypothetical protein B0H10DRAFT_1950837 [Mycena sp. CBHHK59/15]
MAQARAKPSQASIPGFGSGLGFLKPKPDKARPKPWFAGQAKPAHHYSLGFKCTWHQVQLGSRALMKLSLSHSPRTSNGKAQDGWWGVGSPDDSSSDKATMSHISSSIGCLNSAAMFSMWAVGCGHSDRPAMHYNTCALMGLRGTPAHCQGPVKRC